MALEEATMKSPHRKAMGLLRNVIPAPTDTAALETEIAALRAANAALKSENGLLKAQAPAVAERHRRFLLGAFNHDMRTSLNDITGFASILDDEIPGPLNIRQRGFVGKIFGGAERLLRLIENLTAAGAIEAGELRVTQTPVDFGRLLEQAIEPLRPMADNRMTRIQLRADVPGRPELDPRSLTLVIGNMVSNALRLNGLGGMIDIDAHVEGDTIVTTIRDYGPGLTASDMALLAESPAEAARRGPGEFSVALSRQLVEAQGGQMGFDSRSGAGCTTWFRLPYSGAVKPALEAIA